MLDLDASRPHFSSSSRVTLASGSSSITSLSSSPLSLEFPIDSSMFNFFSVDDASPSLAESLDGLDSRSPDDEEEEDAGPAVSGRGSGGRRPRMSQEEKKRRNRDCMRRLRDRRSGQISSMRQEIRSLEDSLNSQLEITAGSSNPASGDPASSSSMPSAAVGRLQLSRRLQVDHAKAKKVVRQLREENYWLQKQIAKRAESLDAVQKIMVEQAEACPPIDVDALEEEDIGVWIRNTDHFFPPLEDARAFEIVMDSYRIIQEGIRITQRFATTTNAVLGWADQRSVDKQWANFMMQKPFPHENARDLALKTWQLLSNVGQISVLQPKSHEMKVLQRLNDSTLVIARHTYFKPERISYCMIYLLFMIETDDGFVVGSRSLDPDEDKMKVFTSERMTVAKPFHCFHFQQTPETGGCRLTFAGRVDNIHEGYAKSCAMDMLLAMMRWESQCVSPLWRLAC